MSSGPILYPHVTSLPGHSKIEQPDRQNRKQEGVRGEFDHVFDKVVNEHGVHQHGGHELGHVKSPLKFSAHAAQRLQDRKISFDPQTMSKISDAVDKAAAKGVDDTLVLTDKAALIVSAKNRTVITAMDRNSLAGNVFTNIDGAVIV